MKCPQNILLNNQNGLVVGALASSSETQMANYGNFGARAVDIATRAPSGTHLDGTSFTAAIVSEYANQLAKEFPQLSVSDIRLAILLGAEIPDLQNPLPVRSGGILNEFYARRLAQLIQAKRRALSGGPTLWNQSSRIHFLQTAFLDRVSHEEVSRRIQILDRSGLLSEGGR